MLGLLQLLLFRQRVVRSHDGTVHYVFVNPDDAFPYYCRDTKSRIAATTEAFQQVKSSVDASYEQTISQVLFRITDKNEGMQLHIRNAYLAYAASPSSSSLEEF